MSWTFKQSIQRVWKYPFIQKQLQLYNNVEFSLCYIKNPAPQLLSSASSRQAGCEGSFPVFTFFMSFLIIFLSNFNKEFFKINIFVIFWLKPGLFVWKLLEKVMQDVQWRFWRSKTMIKIAEIGKFLTYSCEKWKWPLVWLSPNISASTWPKFKIKDSFEILRTSRFQNWPYFLNLVEIWWRYCQKTVETKSPLFKDSPFSYHKNLYSAIPAPIQTL